MKKLFVKSLLALALSAPLFAYADRYVIYTVEIPTIRTDKSTLPRGEISSFVVEEYVDSRLVNTYTMPTNIFEGRPIAAEGKITARAAVVDTRGQQSEFTSFVEAVAKPSAPGGLSGTVTVTTTTTTTTTIETVPGR